jgi:hypothetical protein
MIGNKNIGRLYGICLATMYATLTTATVRGFWRVSGTLLLVIFVAFWIGFYFTGVWVAVDRPSELNRKLPLRGKELQRRKKEFYDWLASPGKGR